MDGSEPEGLNLDVVGWNAEGRALRVTIAILVPLPPFPDVAVDSVHELAITRLAALGGTTGLADGSYGPAATVTRGQMASFLTRTLGLLDEDAVEGDDAAEETDDSDVVFEHVVGSVHAAAVEAVVAAGIAQGYGDGRFGVGDPIRRDQMASMLASAAQLPAAPTAAATAE